jgi:thiol-disulfide isomerase/thioredoxin
MKKRTSIITAIVFVAVLITAVLLYNGLRDRVSPETNPPVLESGEAASGTADLETSEQSDEGSGTDEDTTGTENLLIPDFTITDSGGNEISFSDFRGKPVVLNFWASWCPPCKQEMPEFEKLYQEFESEIQFVMLALTDGQRETTETASSFIKAQGYTFPVYFDTNREGAMMFGIQSIPTTFFIDSDGYLTDFIIGMLDESVLRRSLENL